MIFLKKNFQNLELAIQEFIKGAEKDIKKRNFDKKIATTCAEKVWSCISPLWELFIVSRSREEWSSFQWQKRPSK